jgi:hypothetical protein
LDGAWHFTLITGTNRLKTLDEIMSPENVEQGDWIKITVAGLAGLKSVLSRLPSGTSVSWHRARHLDQSALETGPRLRQPPGRLVREIRAHCAQVGVDLHTGR